MEDQPNLDFWILWIAYCNFLFNFVQEYTSILFFTNFLIIRSINFGVNISFLIKNEHVENNNRNILLVRKCEHIRTQNSEGRLLMFIAVEK